MKVINNLKWIIALGGIAFGVAAPSIAPAQSLGDLDRAINRRQDKKNEWRNIAIASGGLAVLGLLSKDSTLTFVGATGALYSAYRYEQDRKSQSKLARARAAYFQRGSFTRNGVRYVRKTTWKKGKKYYYFARA
jgi:hypothetical protein